MDGELRECATEMHVGHDADDRPPRRGVVAKPDLPTERIAVAEESLDEPLVDDSDGKTPLTIRVGERSSGDWLRTEHIEVRRRDHDSPGPRMILFRRIRRAADREPLHLRRPSGGQVGCIRDGPNARQPRDPLPRTIIEL